MGTTIGKLLISYDVDMKHSEVKNAMLTLNYYDGLDRMANLTICRIQHYVIKQNHQIRQWLILKKSVQI